MYTMYTIGLFIDDYCRFSDIGFIFMPPFFGKLFSENLAIFFKKYGKKEHYMGNMLKKYSKIEVIYEVKISVENYFKIGVDKIQNVGRRARQLKSFPLVERVRTYLISLDY